MSLDNKYIHCAIARLSGVLEALEVLLRNPLICNALVALGVLMTLRSFSRALSRWAFNNWRRSKAWTPERELVLLTGGCSGIGWQVMEDLASTGVRVVILDIAPPNFALPNSASFYRANVSSPQSIAEVAKAIRSDHGEPTILVNNAGVGHDGTILDEFYEDIRHTFEVNTLSHFAMVKEFAPSMVRANHGHIVTVASFASFAGMGGMVDYCCSNASALAFHEGLRLELRYWYKAPNVRTTLSCTSIIHPSWVRTPMIKGIAENESQFWQRILRPQEVSQAICNQIVRNSGDPSS
ncbi:putative short-chain dehydrogenase/reductase 2 [Aspergillus similis]